jgi:hypothetical protein
MAAVLRALLLCLALAVLVLADAAAVALLLEGRAALSGLLVVHAACAIGSGITLASATPSFVRHTWRDVALFAAVISLLVPACGPIGVLLMLRLGLREARPARSEPWLVLDLETGAGDVESTSRRRRISVHPHVSAADLRAVLALRTTETAGKRFEALLATQQLSPKSAVSLLELAQTDPSEEIRLYAFSRLERMRGELEEQIEQIMKRLPEATEKERARLHLRLAECYWELGDRGLTEGAVLEHALEKARENVSAACALQPLHAAAEFFRGRILVHGREAAHARAAFERAMRAGYPRVRILPYLAECAFHERDLGAVGSLLAELEGSAEHSLSGPVIDLWCGAGGASGWDGAPSDTEERSSGLVPRDRGRDRERAS